MATKKTTAPAKKTKSKSTGSAQGNAQLEKYFIDSLKDIYWAEKALTKALPKMQKASTTEELHSAIGEHLTQTTGHVTRLEQVFKLLGKKAQAKKCDAMEGLTKEGEGVIETTDTDTPARDLGIIMASQKVEHYEMSAYMGLIKLADSLGYEEIAGILNETLIEEEDSDELLADIAAGEIFQKQE